jgi:predicted Fe-S protein YdhL (DUF1289 family)
MIESPCIKVCRMDRELGLCLGCFRTFDEIAVWSQARDEVRLGILATVARRRVRLDPWEGDQRCDCE